MLSAWQPLGSELELEFKFDSAFEFEFEWKSKLFVLFENFSGLEPRVQVHAFKHHNAIPNTCLPHAELCIR